jgi:hypothetical protein
LPAAAARTGVGLIHGSGRGTSWGDMLVMVDSGLCSSHASGQGNKGASD